MVDGIVGRLGLCGAFRRAHGAKCRLALDLLWSAALSLLGMLLVRGPPESKAESAKGGKFDLPGVITFMIMMVALQVFATRGGFGWFSPSHAALISVIFNILFVRIG